MNDFKKVKINGKAYNIVFNGFYAQHICDEFEEKRNQHPYLHIAIQKELATANFVLDDGKNKVGYKYYTKETNLLVIPVIVRGDYVIPKTCYVGSMDILTSAKKKAGISALNDFWPEHWIDMFYDMQDVLLISDAELVMERIAKQLLRRK